MSPTKNHILINLSSSDKTSFGKEEFVRQSLPQKVFSAIWAVESAVNNGGSPQYFVNSSAESLSQGRNRSLLIAKDGDSLHSRCTNAVQYHTHGEVPGASISPDVDLALGTVGKPFADFGE